MSAPGFALFDTALGACGLAWGERGLAGVMLPEIDGGRLRERLTRRHPGAAEAPPPAPIARAIEAITALLAGEPRDLKEIALELDRVGAFEQRVYGVAREIPPGLTLTYGEVAARVGEPGAAQAVGRAMGRNPWPIVVPCHRVVGAGGRAGGFSAPGGARTKLRMLQIEGGMTRGLPLFDR